MFTQAVVCIIFISLRCDCVTVSCCNNEYLTAGHYHPIYTATQGQLVEYPLEVNQEIKRVIQEDAATIIHSIYRHQSRVTFVEIIYCHFVVWRKEGSASTYWAIIGPDNGGRSISDPRKLKIHFHGDITVIWPFALTMAEINDGEVVIEELLIPASRELSDAISLLDRQKLALQLQVTNLTAEIESRQQIVSETQSKIDCLEQEHFYASREWKTQKMKLRRKLERTQKIANQTEEENKALRKAVHRTRLQAEVTNRTAELAAQNVALENNTVRWTDDSLHAEENICRLSTNLSEHFERTAIMKAFNASKKAMTCDKFGEQKIILSHGIFLAISGGILLMLIVIIALLVWGCSQRSKAALRRVVALKERPEQTKNCGINAKAFKSWPSIRMTQEGKEDFFDEGDFDGKALFGH